MKTKSYLPIALSISILSLVAFVILAVQVSGHHLKQFDHVVAGWIQSLENPTLTQIMKFFTFIGSTVSVVVISVILLFLIYKVFKRRTELYLYAIVLVGTVAFNQALKYFFKRARPDVHRLIEETGYSFPSGHSMMAFAMYGIISFLMWKHIRTRLGRGLLIVISILFILMIGGSRIYLGVHYPSDVVGGYCFSLFWLVSSIFVYQRQQEKHAEGRRKAN